MSLLKQLMEEGRIKFYADYRSGSYKDHSGNLSYISKSNNELVHKSSLTTDNGGITYSSIDLGTDNFSVISKVKRVFGTVLWGLAVSGVNAFLTGVLDGTLGRGTIANTMGVNSLNLSNSLPKTPDQPMSWGITVDRTGNLRGYSDGLYRGQRDISDLSELYISGNPTINFSISNRSFYQDYCIIVSGILTDSEMAELTAELENKKWTSKTSTKTKPVNLLKNSKLITSTDWTLGTDGTSGNNWTINNGYLRFTSLEGVGSPVLATANINKLTAGKLYKISMDVESSAASYRMRIDHTTPDVIVDYTTVTSNRRYLFYWSPAEDRTTIRFFASQVSGSFEIKNIVIEEVSIGVSRGNMIGNYEFTNESEWILSDTSIDTENEKLVFTGGVSNAFARIDRADFYPGKYKVEIEIVDYVSGNLRIYEGISANSTGVFWDNNGSFSQIVDFKQGARFWLFSVGTGAPFTGKVNKVSLTPLDIEGRAVDYKTENGIRADQKSSITDNKLSNTDFIASNTTFKVSDDFYPGSILSDSVLVDGDMEAPNTNAWMQSGGTNPTKEKLPSDLPNSTQLLRIASPINSLCLFSQNDIMKQGTSYRIRGYLRGDGLRTASLRMNDGTNTTTIGETASNTWLYVDKIVKPTAGSGRIWLYSLSSTAPGYAEFDLLTVEQVREDAKALEYTHVSSGDYVYMPSSSMNLTPTQAAYGEWKFWFKKGHANCTLRAGIISSEAVVPNSGTNDGYYIYVGASSSLSFVRVTGGTPATLITGTPITDLEYHEIKVIRDSSGLFELFVDGVSQGTVNNNTHFTSNFMVFNPEGASSKLILSSEKGNYGVIKK